MDHLHDHDAENRLESNYARYLGGIEQTIEDSYTQDCMMSYTPDIVEKIAPTDFKKMERKRLQEEIQKLTFNQRKVIEHYYFLNKNQQQIAGDLRMSHAEITKTLKRAFAVMKEVY
ncbi:TPA: sigma-70 family RNA polymerase sigma factor [Enterococcus faecium]|nr:sigma-70 family RNA polymerase sigma factor [Enterococcus faecium]